MEAFRSTLEVDSEGSSDRALLERLQDGDRQALIAFDDRYSKYVYSVALRILNQSAAAEDVTQEVFLQLWVQPLQFEYLTGTMHGWLAVTSRNRAISLLRLRREDSLEGEDLASPHEFRKVSDENTACHALFSKLHNDQQILFGMAFLEGRTHVEIAAATGYPLGTIKTRILSALAEMGKGAAG